MATVQDVVNRITRLLSQVSGENVQLYAEDRILDMLQNKYDTLFDKLWWPTLMRRLTKTLDGTSGLVTVNFTSADLTRFGDIRHIYIEGDVHPIPEVPLNINPAVTTGTRAKYYEPNETAGKIFKCYPITSTGNIIIHYRFKQAAFVDDPTAEINFDDNLLVAGVVYDYLEDDGTNPGATEKYRNIFNGLFRDAKGKHGARIIPFNRRTPSIPTVWT